MDKTFEVELRGPVSQESYGQLKTLLDEQGVLLQTRSRILIDYSTFLPNEGIKERQRDIRLRITNGKPEIIIKTGSWGGSDQRKELSVFAEEGSFDRLVQAFHVLGYDKGVLCVRNSLLYKYKEVEFALVEVPGHSYYFEAEKMSDEAGKDAATQEIADLCKTLGLTLFSDQTFFEYIDTLNREANEVFDFKDYTEDYFKKRFKL